MKWPWTKPAPIIATFPCDSCRAPLLTVTDKHRIGSVWIEGIEHAKFCDGTEVIA